jgi:hypothetical protein
MIFGRVSEADPPPAEKYCVTRGVYRMRGWLVTVHMDRVGIEKMGKLLKNGRPSQFDGKNSLL